MQQGSPPMNADHIDVSATGVKLVNPDDIREGDTIATTHDIGVQSRETVIETDVIWDDDEYGWTAGIEVRDERSRTFTRTVSYEFLADTRFRVWRDADALTDEEREAVRGGVQG